MPSLGERVFIRPAPGLVIQRAQGTFGQFLDPAGQDVVWDTHHQASLDRGEVLLAIPPAEKEPA